ncbi:MAG: Fic family protein [Fimbriimonadaceae bacterium]|nr:Fic family protein [Fimbriimonadaceae bacterium]
MQWQPIEDYSTPWQALQSEELRGLAAVWQTQRNGLEDRRALEEFTARLCRAWAIETGLLERLYSMDRGITTLLIEQGLDASLIPHGATDQSPAQVMAVIRDQHQAVEWLFDLVAQQRPLSNSFLGELHQLMTQHQPTTDARLADGTIVQVPLERGRYKRHPNNPQREDGEVHWYCPPEHVDAEMDRLLGLHREHRAAGVAPEVEAAWLHHRFTQIHPFQDGNGRIARAIATMEFLRAGWFPLVVRDPDRELYIGACEAADAGDLAPLVQFFAHAQREAFLRALDVAREAEQAVAVSQSIERAKAALRVRRDAALAEWNQVRQLAGHLQDAGAARLRAVAEQLADELTGLIPEARFGVDQEPPSGTRARWHHWQIEQTAKQLGYFANLAEHSSWVRLILDVGDRSEILLATHNFGTTFRGVLATCGCFFQRIAVDDDQRRATHPVPLAGTCFQLNYEDRLDPCRERYLAYLERVVVEGLEHWRQGL